MRYAVIYNNVIENITEWDGISPSTLPVGRSVASIENVFVDIGWLWNGGAPTNPNPSPPPLPPPDFSNLDNLDKTFRALGLMIANFTGKTPVQVKQAFQSAYQSLPQ